MRIPLWLSSPLLVVLGVGTAIATVARGDQSGWVALGVVATFSSLLWLHPGWARSSFAIGWLVVWGAVLLGRGEGDYAITSNLAGYAILLTGFGVIVVALGTLPKPTRRSKSGSGQSSTLD